MKTKIMVALFSFFILLPSLMLAQSGRITLPAQAFIPESSEFSYSNQLSVGGPSYLYISAGSGGFLAPVVFPPDADGLQVKILNALVGDDDYASYIRVRLYRMNRYSGLTQPVFAVATTDVDTPGKIKLTDTSGGYKLINSDIYG